MDPREELAALRRLAELEAKASGGTYAPAATSAQSESAGDDWKTRVDASKYWHAGDQKTLSDLVAPDRMKTSVSDLPWYARAAGGAKTSWDRAAMGLKGMFTDLSDKDKELLEQGRAFDKLSGAAGTAGNIAADVAITAAPGMKLQGVLTRGATKVLPKAASMLAPYLGAAGSGAAVTAAVSPEDRVGGAVGGALAGAGGEAAGRVLQGAWGSVRAALDPLTEKGRERVLRRTIERFAEDQAAVRARAANPEVFVPGAMPTLAEATGDSGIAQLQRAAASASPEVASALEASRKAKFGAYRKVLDDMSGTDEALRLATESRDGAAEALYGKAFQSDAMRRDLAMQQAKASAPFAGVGGAVPTGDLATPGLRDLMQRPGFKEAAERARVLAANKGVDIGNPIESLQGLHYIKLALDDMMNPQAASAMGRNASSAVQGMRQALTKELETISPTYGAALSTYADMSIPINQMEIARALRDKALPALTDFSNGDLARTTANRYAQALRNSDEVVRNSTGMKSMSMEDIMSPDQMAQLRGIGKDMARRAGAEESAKAVGSPTAQYLAGQNVIRQALGPLGLPRSIMESTAVRITSALANLPYKFTEEQTQQLMARALTDPQTAAKILQAKDPRMLVEILQPYMAQVAVQANMMR